MPIVPDSLVSITIFKLLFTVQVFFHLRTTKFSFTCKISKFTNFSLFNSVIKLVYSLIFKQGSPNAVGNYFRGSLP